MSRNEIETAVRSAYAARAANDPIGVGAIFSPDARFTDAGHPTHCSAAATYVGPQIHQALKALCDNFRASNYEMRSLLIDGDRAAAICRADFQYVLTSETFSLDLVHFWTFKDGKAVELVEYFDTAHVAHVVSKAPLRGPNA